MSIDLAIVGNVSKDTVRYGENTKKPFWGGAGLNISVAAAQAGKKPKLISVIGNDGLNLLSLLKDLVDVSFIKIVEGSTCRFYIQYSKTGTVESIYSEFGVAKFINTYFQKLELCSAHYHICCRTPLEPNLIVPRLVTEKLPFSLDFIVSSASQQMLRAKDSFQYADYVFINRQEFEILQNILDINIIKKLIITAGSEPVIVLEFGNEVLCQPCSQKDFHDVTGAGDVFIGTFLAYQLNGENLIFAISESINAAQKTLNSLGIW